MNKNESYKKIVIPQNQLDEIEWYCKSNPNSLKSVIEQEHKKKTTD